MPRLGLGPVVGQSGGDDVRHAGTHQLGEDYLPGIVPARQGFGHGVTQLLNPAPLHDALVHGAGHVPGFNQGLLQRVHENLIGPGQRLVVHLAGPPSGWARANDSCSGGQPLSPQYGFHVGCDADHYVAARYSLLAAIHWYDPYPQGAGHILGKRFSTLRRAAEGPDFFDAAYLANGLQLGGSLVPGANNAQGGGIGIGQILHRHAGGGSGPQLPQSVGLGIAEQLAGSGVVKADLKGILSANHCIGLDTHDVVIEQTAPHHREQPAFGNDLAPGQVVRRALPEPALHGFDSFQHVGHREAAVNIFVFKKKSH